MSEEAKITNAYQALFNGRGSKDDAQTVLGDMAKRSGYYNTLGIEGLDPMKMAYIEGQRNTFAAIVSYLNLSEEEKKLLVNASRAKIENGSDDGVLKAPTNFG